MGIAQTDTIAYRLQEKVAAARSANAVSVIKFVLLVRASGV